jgi:hypothetical protein
MRLVSDVGSSPPVLAPVPEGYVPIGSGTFFGRPWTVSAAPHPDRRLCVAFGYAGVALGSTCGVPFDQLAGMPPSARPVRPAWARSSFVLGLDTSSDGQRFLYVATNGEVTSLTVRAGGGAFVRGTALPRHLGDVSYFVLSLGRPHGACHELCQGTVSVRFATAHGPTLVDGQGQLLAQDHGGNGGFLSAPVRS